MHVGDVAVDGISSTELTGRLGLGSSIRLTYFGDIETLIVKLMSEPQERTKADKSSIE